MQPPTRRFLLPYRMHHPWLMMLVGISFILSACRFPFFPNNTINPDNYIAAIYTGLQSFEGLPFERGYIVFVKEDGTFDLYPHGRMDRGDIKWNDTGLYFTDDQYDYIFNSNTQRIPVEKPDFLEEMIESEQGTIIGIYNRGFAKHSYEEILVNHTAPNPEPYTFTHYVQAGGFCGERAFVFGENSNKANQGAQTDLYQVYEDNHFMNKQILSPKQILDHTSFLRGQIPCKNNIIIALTDNETHLNNLQQLDSVTQSEENITNEDLSKYIEQAPHNYSLALIQQWDTKTKKRIYIPLNINKEPFIFKPNMFDQSHIVELKDNNLSWLHPTGQIYQTNINTGDTTPIGSSIFPKPDHEYRFEVTATDKAINVFFYEMGIHNPSAHIVRLDPTTYAPFAHIEIPNIEPAIGQGQVMRGFAFNPNK